MELTPTVLKTKRETYCMTFVFGLQNGSASVADFVTKYFFIVQQSLKRRDKRLLQTKNIYVGSLLVSPEYKMGRVQNSRQEKKIKKCIIRLTKCINSYCKAHIYTAKKMLSINKGGVK